MVCCPRRPLPPVTTILGHSETRAGLKPAPTSRCRAHCVVHHVLHVVVARISAIHVTRDLMGLTPTNESSLTRPSASSSSRNALGSRPAATASMASRTMRRNMMTPRSEVPEALLPLAQQALGSLGDDVLLPDVAAEGHERSCVVGLDLAPGGLAPPHPPQPLEDVRVGAGVVVDGEQHEVVVVVGREEHEVLVVGACFLQHLRLHPCVDELGVAHLEDAGQPQAHLVDELGALRRTRLGHDDLHAVRCLHGLVVQGGSWR